MRNGQLVFSVPYASKSGRISWDIFQGHLKATLCKTFAQGIWYTEFFFHTNSVGAALNGQIFMFSARIFVWTLRHALLQHITTSFESKLINKYFCEFLYEFSIAHRFTNFMLFRIIEIHVSCNLHSASSFRQRFANHQMSFEFLSMLKSSILFTDFVQLFVDRNRWRIDVAYAFKILTIKFSAIQVRLISDSLLCASSIV